MAFAAISFVLDQFLFLSNSSLRKILTIDLCRSSGLVLGNFLMLLDKNLRVRFSFTAVSLAPMKPATWIHDVKNDFELALFQVDLSDTRCFVL